MHFGPFATLNFAPSFLFFASQQLDASISSRAHSQSLPDACMCFSGLFNLLYLPLKGASRCPSMDIECNQFPCAGFPVLRCLSSFLIIIMYICMYGRMYDVYIYCMYVHILPYEVPSESSIIVQGKCNGLPSVPPRHPIFT